MLALPTLTLTPIIRLHQSAATSSRTLNRGLITMVLPTSPKDSGSANTTARETKSNGRSQEPKGTRRGGPAWKKGAPLQRGSGEGIRDGSEAERGGWKGRGGRGRGGARRADTGDRPTHFLALPLHTHVDLRNRVTAFQNALFSMPPLTSTSTGPSSAAQLLAIKGKRPLRVSSIVEGLDSSIVIDAHRLHMTLGVMALQKEDVPIAPGTRERQAPLQTTAPSSSTSALAAAPANSDPSTSLPSELHESEVPLPLEPAEPPRTVATALTLLRSLQPQISAILAGSNGVQVPLEVLDVLKTARMKAPRPRHNTNTVTRQDSDSPVKMNDMDTGNNQAEAELDLDRAEKVGAGVLFVAPKHVEWAEEDEERRKLREVSELIHRAFKDAGYITEQRPLKLHCTLLNASHRKPARRLPFAYTDVLAASSACALLDMPDPIPAVLEEGRESALGVVDVSPSVAVPESPLPPPPPSSSVHLSADALSFSSSAARAGVAVEGNVVPSSNSSGTHPHIHSVLPTSDASPCTTTAKAKAKAKEERPRYPPPPAVPPPRAIALGTYHVGEVQLWVMGSHGRHNEYVSCGGVKLE